MGSIAKGAATGKKKVGVAAQKLLASRKVRQAKARVKKIGKVIPKSAMVRGAPVPKDTPKVKPKKVNYNTLTGRLNDLVKRSQGVENVVKGQAKSKWASLKKWRKDREDEQRRRREEELEAQKQAKPTIIDGKKAPKKKGGGILGFFKNILLGGLVVMLVKSASKIINFFKSLYSFVGKYFWLVRTGLYFLTKINFKSVITKVRGAVSAIGKFLGPKISKLAKFLGDGLKKIASALKNFLGNLGKKALDVMNTVKNGVANAAKGAWNAVKAFGTQTWKKAGQLVPRKVRVSSQKLLKTASKKVKDVAKVGKNIVQGAKAATTTAVKTAKTVAKTASTVGKTALQTGKAVVGKGVTVVGKIGKWVSKLFGPKLAKEVAGAPTLFKGLSKAAKGIKIPIIGPLMVGVMSLLGGEPVGKTLFKVMGAGIGGAIGMAFANPFTMILGEMVGEFLGDLMYTIFMDPEGGMDKAGEIFKEKFKSILEGGKKVFEFMGKGFKRFWGGFMEEHSFNFFGKKIPNVVQLMNPLTTGPLLVKAFFSDEPMSEEEKEKEGDTEDGKKEEEAELEDKEKQKTVTKSVKKVEGEEMDEESKKEFLRLRKKKLEVGMNIAREKDPTKKEALKKEENELSMKMRKLKGESTDSSGNVLDYTKGGSTYESAQLGKGSGSSDVAASISKEDPSQDSGQGGGVMISTQPPETSSSGGGNQSGDVVVGGSTKSVLDRYNKRVVAQQLYV